MAPGYEPITPPTDYQTNVLQPLVDWMQENRPEISPLSISNNGWTVRPGVVEDIVELVQAWAADLGIDLSP